MIQSIHLTLLMGPAVPVPAPKELVDCAISMQVSAGGTRTGFQLVFAAGKDTIVRKTLLPAGFFEPPTRVILVVTAGGIPTVLADGIITRHEMSPGNASGAATLTVTGEDLSILMDIVNLRDFRYPASPDMVVVATILARYVALGIAPVIIPPIFPYVPTPQERIPTQNGTDRAYIQQLASRNGHVFFVDPGPAPGANIAYWGPDIRVPVPQPALNIDMDANTNVESLSFTVDGLAKKITVLNVLDPVTKKITIPIPVPNLSILRPPLGARVGLPMKVEFSDETSKLNPVEAVARALAFTADSADSVNASGTLDVLRYGHILRARQVVGVRGAGLAHDGLYYVKSVTHDIKRGQYKQNFSLSRDGLISLTPKVVP